MTDLQIQYFLKVSDTMSFSAAAQQMFVSQPSVSRQIGVLEKELGFRLFDRSNKNAISLTPAGLVFRDSFRKMNQDLITTMKAAEEVSREPNLQLTVGIGADWDLTDALAAFRDRVKEQYPSAVISFTQGSFRDLRRRLLDGELEAIVCTTTSVQAFDEIVVEPVADFQTTMYALKALFPDGHRPTWKDFGDMVLLMLPEEEVPMSHEIIQLQFMAHHLKPRMRRMPNRSALYQAVLLGEGFAVFDEHMMIGHDVRLISYRTKEAIPISLVYRSGNQNPLIRLFLERMRGKLGKRVLSDAAETGTLTHSGI